MVCASLRRHYPVQVVRVTHMIVCESQPKAPLAKMLFYFLIHHKTWHRKSQYEFFVFLSSAFDEYGLYLCYMSG